jgi:hypothetical protein
VRADDDTVNIGALGREATTEIAGAPRCGSRQTQCRRCKASIHGTVYYTNTYIK